MIPIFVYKLAKLTMNKQVEILIELFVYLVVEESFWSLKSDPTELDLEPKFNRPMCSYIGAFALPALAKNNPEEILSGFGYCNFYQIGKIF